MTEQIKLTTTINVAPKKIYDAWLNGKEHGAMTGGGKAKASNKIGGSFSAGDNYMHGKNLELVTNKRILQSWRSTDFAKDNLDSLLLIKLEKIDRGTKLTLIHSEIPEGQGGGYKKGWKEFYFKPMKKCFCKSKT